MVWTNFILFAVIPFFPEQPLVYWWIIVRCFNKIIRHVYNAYLCLKMKLQYYWLDWFRMSSFYIFYTVEMLIATCLVLKSMPHVKEAKTYQMPNRFNFCIDLTLIYFA